MHMLNGLLRAKGLVFGMFSEVSQDVEQLLKFCTGNIAERWAVLNGLPGEEALQCVTWQLKRQWSFTALRANVRVRIECAHHVTYHQAGGGSQHGVAPRRALDGADSQRLAEPSAVDVIGRSFLSLLE